MKLSIYIYHPTIEIQKKLYFKPHHGRFIEELSAEFERIFVVAPFYKESRIPEWMRRGVMYNYAFKAQNIELVRGFSRSILYPLRFFQYLKYLLKSDILLFFTPSIASLFLAPIALILRKPYVCYVAIDIDAHYSQNALIPKLGSLLGYLQNSMIARSSGILATGAKNLRSWPKVKYVERVTPLLEIDIRNASLTEGHAHPNQAPSSRLLFLGVINRRKRIEIAIRAVAQLREMGKRYDLDILGAASPGHEDYESSLRALVRELNIEDQVQFHGHVRDPKKIEQYLKNSDFLLLLSTSEGFPKVVYEALGLGVVPVLTRLNSYEGILEDKRHALFVDPEPRDVANTIINTPAATIEEIRKVGIQWVSEIIRRPASRQFTEMAVKILDSRDKRDRDLDPRI